MTIFGLNLEPLYEAIEQVERKSGNRSTNVYNLSPFYVLEVNRILRFKSYCVFPGFRTFDVNSVSKSRDMMLVFWKFYGDRYRNHTDTLPTYEVLARLHYGGPTRFQSRCTFPYWLRVRRVLDRNGIRY